jgi:hypothetical protein
LFELESGGDVRCFIIDNHRPIHLSNIHSRHNVVVFEDETSILLDEALIPDDGSDLSDADEDSSDEEQEDIYDVEDEGDGDEDEREEIINKEDIQNAFGEEEEFEEERDEDIKEDGAAIDEDAAGNDEDVDPNQTLPMVQTALDTVDSSADESDQSMNSEGERKVGKKAKRRESSAADDMDVTRVENWKSGDDLEEEKEEDANITRNLDEDNEVDEDSQEEDNKRSGKGKKSGSKEKVRDYDDDQDRDEGTVEDLDDDDEVKGDEEDEEGEIKVTGRRKSAPIDYKKLRREKLRGYYHNNSWNTAPTALMLIHLLSNVQSGRLSQEMLWQAALGLTDMYLRGAVSEDDYANYCDSLRMLLGNTVQDAREKNRYQVPIEEAKVSDTEVVARLVSTP